MIKKVKELLEEAKKEAERIKAEILKHGKEPLLVIAGPGTGKSTTLAERAAFLVDQKDVPPDKVYLLSFTNASASDLREKLKNKTDKASEISLSTVHKLANKILKENYKNKYYISDFTDDLIIIKDAYPTKSYKELKNFLRKINKKIATLEKKVDERYNKIKNFYKSFNFYEITAKVIDLLENVPFSLAKYQNKIEYLIVDEYQDLNPLDQKFIQLLSSSNKIGLAICGDDDQSIYGFRYAFPNRIVRNFYSGKFTNKMMGYCWRSPQAIIEVSRPIIEMVDKELNINRVPKSLYGQITHDKVKIISLPSATDKKNKEAEWIANKIKDIISKARKKDKEYKILVLASEREITKELKLLLEDANIPVKSWRKRILKLRKCKLLYHGLRFIRESKDNFSVRAIIHLLQKNINLSKIVDLAIDEKKSLWSIIKEKSPPQLSAFIKIFKTLEIIGKEVDLIQILEKVRDTFRIDKTSEEYKKIEEMAKSAKNIDDLLSTIATEYLDIENYEVEGLIENRQIVEIMTMHSSKGLSADSVFIMGMENQFIPRTKLTPDNIRLFYVALTRSRGKLFITFVRSRRTRLARGQYKRKRSIFIDEILKNSDKKYFKYERLS